MKEKEPNRTILSADESPVPLPSVEEAWSDMRKRLDEEMPERIVFFWFRRGTLLILLLLLSLGAFLLIRRSGESARPAAGERIVRAKDSGRDAYPNRTTDQRQGGAVDREKGGVGDQADQRKEGDGPGERPVVEGSGKLRSPAGTARNRPGIGEEENTGGVVGVGGAGGAGEHDHAMWRKNKLGNAAQKNDVRPAWANNDLTGVERGSAKKSNGKMSYTKTGREKPGIVKPNDPQRAIIDPRLVQTGTGDPIGVKVDMPRRTAGTGKKNAPTPEQPKKPATKPAKQDSTRILWAAGLQDSKSFPVGAQQAYNYDANLKKDLWADYIPSPYFQYHISGKIAFQTALQLNNPQYTESVTIFRKAGDSSGGVQTINDTTVTVRKLYYFNIPFLVYYSPLRNLSLGAGLQFSNLRSGIAFQNNSIHHVGTTSLTDTVLTSTVISLKENRPAYNNLRRTDWRAIFELNYYWKRVTLGLQYQQALGNYLYTPVEGSSGRDRNSSFNIYLRYNLWERRIKITPKH